MAHLKVIGTKDAGVPMAAQLATDVAEVSAASGVILKDEVVLEGATPGTYLSEAFLITFDSTASLYPEFNDGPYSLYWLKPSGGLVDSKAPAAGLVEAGTYVVVAPSWAGVTTFNCSHDNPIRLARQPQRMCPARSARRGVAADVHAAVVVLMFKQCSQNRINGIDVQRVVAAIEIR